MHIILRSFSDNLIKDPPTNDNTCTINDNTCTISILHHKLRFKKSYYNCICYKHLYMLSGIYILLTEYLPNNDTALLFLFYQIYNSYSIKGIAEGLKHLEGRELEQKDFINIILFPFYILKSKITPATEAFITVFLEKLCSSYRSHIGIGHSQKKIDELLDCKTVDEFITKIENNLQSFVHILYDFRKIIDPNYITDITKVFAPVTNYPESNLPTLALINKTTTISEKQTTHLHSYQVDVLNDIRENEEKIYTLMDCYSTDDVPVYIKSKIKIFDTLAGRGKKRLFAALSMCKLMRQPEKKETIVFSERLDEYIKTNNLSPINKQSIKRQYYPDVELYMRKDSKISKLTFESNNIADEYKFYTTKYRYLKGCTLIVVPEMVYSQWEHELKLVKQKNAKILFMKKENNSFYNKTYDVILTTYTVCKKLIKDVSIDRLILGDPDISFTGDIINIGNLGDNIGNNNIDCKVKWIVTDGYGYTSHPLYNFIPVDLLDSTDKLERDADITTEGLGNDMSDVQHPYALTKFLYDDAGYTGAMSTSICPLMKEYTVCDYDLTRTKIRNLYYQRPEDKYAEDQAKMNAYILLGKIKLIKEKNHTCMVCQKPDTFNDPESYYIAELFWSICGECIKLWDKPPTYIAISPTKALTVHKTKDSVLSDKVYMLKDYIESNNMQIRLSAVILELKKEDVPTIIYTSNPETKMNLRKQIKGFLTPSAYNNITFVSGLDEINYVRNPKVKRLIVYDIVSGFELDKIRGMLTSFNTNNIKLCSFSYSIR